MSSRPKFSRADKRAMWLASSLMMTLPLAAWLSTTAKADQPTIEQYTAANGPRVCRVLDAFPTFDGIGGIADAIVQEGLFSYYQAGEIAALSVITFCPSHLDLMRRYAGMPAQSNGGAVGGVYRA